MKATSSMCSIVTGARRLAMAMSVLLTGVAGCSSTGPQVHLYSLMPAEIPARVQPPSSALIPIQLELRLPAQVDQPQWLVRLADGSLMSLEQERWTGSLHDEIRQAIFEELRAKWGIVEARTAGGTPPLRVGLDFRRFDSVAGQEARIEGWWALSAGANQDGYRCEWLYREPVAGTFPALAEAHRKAIVRLADSIGAGVVGSRNQSPACTASDLR